MFLELWVLMISSELVSLPEKVHLILGLSLISIGNFNNGQLFLTHFPAPSSFAFPISQWRRWSLRCLALSLNVLPRGFVLAQLFQVLRKARHVCLVVALSQKSALIQHRHVLGFVLQLCLRLCICSMSQVQASLKAPQRYLSLLELLV